MLAENPSESHPPRPRQGRKSKDDTVQQKDNLSLVNNRPGSITWIRFIKKKILEEGIKHGQLAITQYDAKFIGWVLI